MNLYLDTSSLIKVHVEEPGSSHVLDQIDRAAVVVTSPIAYTEMRAALARLRRESALSASAFRAIKREFEDQWPAYLVIDVTSALCRAAGELAERYRVRGFDSLHLAAFAEVIRLGGKANARFSSFDARLNRAARQLSRASR